MGGYPPRVVPKASAAATHDGGATTTVILTSNPVSTPGPNATVELSGILCLQPGTGAGEVQLFVHRGATTSGPAIGTTLYENVSPPNIVVIPFSVTDVPGDVAEQEYCVAVLEAGATANGYVYYVDMGGIIS